MAAHESLIQRFKQHIQKERLFFSGDKILLAVSGGMDSCVMSDLFKKSEYNFGMAHCNFQLRADESDKDEKFVKELAARYGVGFHIQRFETKKYKQQNKLSLEEAARNLRYNWLYEIKNLFGYHYIATAHHLNDSIETVLLNIIRGTGLSGLKGIPVKKDVIVRPLLFANKEEVEIYAKENNISYRNDSSNWKNDFNRNKIRNKIFPVLKSINPSAEHTFAKRNG